jgi:hypothetical protein
MGKYFNIVVYLHRIGSSPTEFTLVDYPTMDELEIY